MKNTINAVCNIPQIASFMKISEESYNKIVAKEDILHTSYGEIKLPNRATMGSCGYDFFCTRDVNLNPGESTVINTFIRANIDEGWTLMVFPKSGLGFKYQVQLANTVGIIDADYFYTESDDNTNEGHIIIKLVNRGDVPMSLSMGNKFCQGVFLPFGITREDLDTPKKVRNGGLGSTGEK